MRDCAVGVALCGEEAGQIDMRFNVVRSELERFVEQSRFLAGRGDHAEIVQDRSIVGGRLERQPVSLLRLDEAARLMALQAHCEQLVGPSRSDGRSP